MFILYSIVYHNNITLVVDAQLSKMFMLQCMHNMTNIWIIYYCLPASSGSECVVAQALISSECMNSICSECNACLFGWKCLADE